MKYRLVIADVDGTLIKPGEQKTKNISPKIISAVEKAQKLGVIFSIATARSLDWVENIIDLLKLNSLIILDNGARIYDCLTQKYIFNAYLTDKKVRKVMFILEKFPYDKYIVDIKARYSYNSNSTPKLKDVVKIMILHISPYEAQEVYEILGKVSDIKVTKSVSGTEPIKESVHITDVEASKEKAIHRIVDFLGIHLDEVMAIGDSYNDFSLLTASGFKVAMGNAVPEIKAIADYIAPSYEDDGVADVLEKFILNNPD